MNKSRVTFGFSRLTFVESNLTKKQHKYYIKKFTKEQKRKKNL